MLKPLTRSRSADFHRATMVKIILAAILLHWFWEPLRPVRDVTATALSTAAQVITR